MKTNLQKRIDRLIREKHELLKTIEQLLRELKNKGRQPSTLAARKETSNAPESYHKVCTPFQF